MSTFFDPVDVSNDRKAPVVEIILNSFPVPDESTSWEQIIEFRSDPDSAGKFSALRKWMSEMTRSRLPAKEVEQSLEWMLYEYQKHLQLHKLKTHAGTIEAIVIAGAEFLENIANRKFSKIAKGLFKVKQRRIALLEGELAAPNREVAYIVHVRESFK